MVVVLAILSVGLLGMIIFFAVSPKSSRLLRMSAIIALGVIGLSLLVSGFFIVKGPSEEPVLIPLPVLTDAPAPAKARFRVTDIVILLALLGVIGLVMAKAMRDQKKTERQTVKPAKPQVFPDAEVLTKSLANDQTMNEEEDSFDIGLDL